VEDVKQLLLKPDNNVTFCWLFGGTKLLREWIRGEAKAVRLVELAWDHCVLNEKLEGNDFEGVLVGGFEDDRAARASLLDLKPTRSTDAPAVAGLEAGEFILRHGGGEVVAKSLGGCEEGSVNDATNGVHARVVGTCFAATGAVEAGRRVFRLATAGVEGLAEDVFAAGFAGFYCGHFLRVSFIIPPFDAALRGGG
jgi:hypothetical protein